MKITTTDPQAISVIRMTIGNNFKLAGSKNGMVNKSLVVFICGILHDTASYLKRCMDICTDKSFHDLFVDGYLIQDKPLTEPAETDAWYINYHSANGRVHICYHDSSGVVWIPSKLVGGLFMRVHLVNDCHSTWWPIRPGTLPVLRSSQLRGEFND